MTMEPKKKRALISIVVAMLIIFFMVGVALIGSAVFYVRRHISTQFVDDQAAAVEFERERARFTGQQPLIELGDNHNDVVHHRVAGTHTELQTLRVLAFDEREGKLVRVSLPFWLLRLMPGKHFNIGNNHGIDFDADRMHLTVDDLERAGPGLVLDGKDSRRGGRVLVWTE